MINLTPCKSLPLRKFIDKDRPEMHRKEINTHLSSSQFLFPFTILGLVFAIRMWTLLPNATRKYLAEVEAKKLAERHAKQGI